ncbi:MAG: zinc ribbon domain-containing protein [Clostridia bacterium]
MFCNHCGSTAEKNQKFCNACGGNLSNADNNAKIEEDHIIRQNISEHNQTEKPVVLASENLATTKKNLMILFSLVGFACMLLPFAKILDMRVSAFSMLGLSEYVFGDMALAFIFFTIGSFNIFRSKLKIAQAVYAVGTIMMFSMLQSYVDNILFSVQIGAWLVAISGALVVFSGFIAKKLCNKNASTPLELPTIVTKIWVVVFVVVFIIVITSNSGTAIFSNKTLPNQ